MIKVGSVVGNKYKILNVIGIGGMGTIFSAIELVSGEKIAIKAANPELSKIPHYGERFILEANIGMNLNHPNIVKIYNYGKEKDQYYLIMEYVDGFNLRQLIRKKGKIDYKQAINISLQILSALSYAYHKGIKAHRDLKPENVIFDRKTGKVKITDFGVAKVEDRNITKGETFYSPHYFAPEQFMPSKFQNTVDGRTDLFAVGVLFYEMLTGKKPFLGETSSEIAKSQYSSPVPPSVLINSIPHGISRICEKALSFYPEDRYQTPEEMAIDLKNGDISQKGHFRRGVDYGYQLKKPYKIAKEPNKLTPSLLPYILIPSVIAAIILAGYFGFPYIKNIIYPPKTNVELVEPLNNKEITPEEFTNFKKNGLKLSWKGLPIADNYHLYVCQLGEDKEGKEVEDSIFGKDKLFDTVKPKTEQNKDNSKEIKDNKNNNDSKEQVITYTIPSDKLFKGFTYCWYVVPVNSKGKELTNNESNEWKFTTPPLEKPELIEPAPNQKNVSLTPTFKWKAKDEDSIDAFKLYVREEGEEKPLLDGKEFKAKELKKDSSTQEFSYLLSPNEKLDYNKTYIWNIEVVKHSINGKFQINIKGDKRTFTTVEKPTTTITPPPSSSNIGGSKTKPQPPETGKLVLNFNNTLFNKTLKVLIDGKVEKANFTPTNKDKSFTIDKLNPGKYKFRIELTPSGWFYENEITITKGKDTPLTIAKSNFKINVTIELTFSKETDISENLTALLYLRKKNEKGEWQDLSTPPKTITKETYSKEFPNLTEGEYRLHLERGPYEVDKDFKIKFGEKPQTKFNNITLKRQ